MQGKSFGIRLLGTVAVILLIASCAPPSAPPVTEAPPAEAATGPAVPAVPTPSVVAEPIDSGPVPGSQADLVANVGDRVQFSFDRFDLSPEARTVLRRQAEWLLQHGSVRIAVEGHCDERGTREYNLALGERRATAVKNYLVALGVASSRIDTISYGKERPVDVRSVEEAWAQNRRGVTIIS